MLRIELKFLTGRYHATPWGRHVNEGAIEWPPSPWRIGRALIAIGFAKAGWTWIPEVAGHAIMCLASTPPVYHLPPATAAHTRHFVLTHKSTSKVIDAFAHPGRAGVMIIEWDLELWAEEISILDTLFDRMSYLGRAESRIAARRVDSVPSGLTLCQPGDAPPGPDWERVELLALMSMADYPDWREEIHQRETERRLERRREHARELRNPRPGTLGKQSRARLDTELPVMPLGALCADTAELRRARWSQPPGSRWLTYWRPGDALDARPDAARCATMGTSTSTPHRVAVLALDGTGRVSSMRDALPRCESVHKALVKHSAELAPQGKPAPCFTGRDRQRKPLQGHRHTTLMPLALGEVSERMDHIVLYTPMGLDAHAVATLQSLTLTYGKELPRLGVRLVEVGQPEDFAAHIPVFGKAHIWASCTPFVPPRHLKESGKNSLAGQVRAELAARGLPEPVAVDIQADTREGFRYLDSAKFWPLWKERQRDKRGGQVRLSERWRGYRRVRQGHAPKPPIDVALGLRLTFSETVQGPVSLGYASHFGLGLFVPSPGTPGCS